MLGDLAVGCLKGGKYPVSGAYFSIVVWTSSGRVILEYGSKLESLKEPLYSFENKDKTLKLIHSSHLHLASIGAGDCSLLFLSCLIIHPATYDSGTIISCLHYPGAAE